jgi:hypothetical protein
MPSQMPRKLGRLLATLAFACAGCGAFGGGSNITYYKVAAGTQSSYTGTNCAATPQDVITWTGIDGDGTVSIAALPTSGQYALDFGGAGSLPPIIEGTLASGTYTFTGSEQETYIESQNINVLEKITVQLTTSGSGFTGTETVEVSCSSNTADQCSGSSAQAQAGDFDCITTGAITGVQIANPENFAPEAVGAPGSPSQP